MKSLKKLFRFGVGPSSSHTIAPSLAASSFLCLLQNVPHDHVQATLYGAMALTGIGHGSADAIKKTLAKEDIEVILDKESHVLHPLTMGFSAFLSGKKVLERTYFSLGGGEISSPDDPSALEKDIYPFRNLESVLSYMKAEDLPDFKAFAKRFEDPDIDDYLDEAVRKMFLSVERGLKADGLVPANGNPKLIWHRVAGAIAKQAKEVQESDPRRELLLTAYAYAVAESSASGEEIVTAPTCGSSGVLPAVLYYEYHEGGKSLEEIRDALYAAGIYGNLIKQNASIAGAIGGCQAEIGTASCMGAVAFAYLEGLDLDRQSFAAECAMEHFLGLSCDPVDGYVIIPCIERNGMGALRSYDAYLYARYIFPVRKNQVSFDNVVSAMKMTGDALASAYKETAEGGLAAILKEK